MSTEAYAGELNEFLSRHRYQPRLTKELDSRTGDLDQLAVNEIVLWKVNRYAPLSPDTLAKINALAKTKTGAHRKAEDCLKALLGEAGVDLPMASTLLRFRNPPAFQIIDRHAYRAVYGEDYPLYTTSGASQKVELYFGYLDALVALSKSRRVPFRDLDRILYVFDRELTPIRK